MWAEILHKLPTAKLLFKTANLSSDKTKNEVYTIFEKLGISPERLILMGRTPKPEHLAAHSKIDIMLDTFPHYGGITTMAALRMGVPVLTCEKEFRMKSSSCAIHLMGLGDWCTSEESEYVKLAIKYANDIPLLKSLRKQLRNRYDKSVLGDSKLYAKGVEAIIVKLWEDWCRDSQLKH
ncbi:MAG: hypothetical protein HQL69_01095 [Magnetococcales bacterium]|nr:hypothetical protein [Magnetococcales bacterium]